MDLLSDSREIIRNEVHKEGLVLKKQLTFSRVWKLDRSVFITLMKTLDRSVETLGREL